MKIGVPKEIKRHEYRVGLTPDGASTLIQKGHAVLVESNAGIGAGFTNDHYQRIGANIIEDMKTVFDESDMIVKVKEPQPEECTLLKPSQILFSFLHLAPDPELSQQLIDSNSVAIAFETITGPDGALPLLAPMSQIAGRMAIQSGMHHLEKPQGGSGVLLSGLEGANPGKVTIIGGGVVGYNAARIAVGVGADVTILEKSETRMNALQSEFSTNAQIVTSSAETIKTHVSEADLLVGAVLIPGGSAPMLVSRDMIRTMQPGSVAVDVAIDQGGCFETSKPTDHDTPTYIEEGVNHYCVTNIPGAVSRSATFALEHVTLPYITTLANDGYKQALQQDEDFRNGLNICEGHVTHEAVARDINQPYTPAQELLS